MEFVNAVTSEESRDYIPFNSRCFEIQSGDDGIPIHRLITAALGMGAESGEFTEVVKKIVFQGKPVNEDNIFHMKRELGDIMWYVAQACMSLDTTIDEIIEMNVEKLQARYPGGSFDVHHSENRAEGDV
jgi:NTP pyrophosphatase (non-canonical NTP hydrolase)